MKQKDIAIIIAIAGVAGFISFFISGAVFVTQANRQQQVEVVDPITTTFTVPSNKYFNNKAVDPTQTIQIGNSSNPAPFSNGSN